MSSSARSEPVLDAIERTIVEFVRHEFLGTDFPLALDTDLLGEGMLDSLGVLRLATYVDEQYQLKMQPEDFVIDNFNTVAALATFIRRTQEQSGVSVDIES